MWLNGLDNVDNLPALSKINQVVDFLIPDFNGISQSDIGDKTLRVDKSEVLVSLQNGSTNKEQKYHRHKDSYYRDKNNELHEMELRKFTVVVFLNEDLD